MSGIERIAAERKRQIEEEGCSAERDDQYTGEELARAATIYAFIAACPERERKRWVNGTAESLCEWPWDLKHFKPTTRIRDLEKAGALIAAEIDRRLRMESGE